MDNEVRAYEIPEGRMPRLEELWGRMIKRASKLSVAAPRLIKGETFERRVPRFDDEGREIPGAARIVRIVPVTIEGEAPKLAGWTFIATIQHAGDAGNIVRTIPGETLPEQYRAGGQSCDHCRLERKRNDTFVVRNESGEHKQIGSTCLQDFLGGMSPEHAVALATFYASAAGYCEDAEGYRDDVGAPRWDLLNVLTITATMTRLHGWCSAGAAKLNPALTSTKGYVEHYLTHRIKGEDDARWFREHEPTTADEGRAREALNWAQGLLDREDAGLSDYLHNLRVLVGVGSADHRGLGLACSILPVAERELGKLVEAAKADRVESQYVGEVGKRSEFILTVMYLNSYETDYGTKTVCKFVDEHGSRVTWFATGSPDLTVGETIRCKATPSKHDTYKDRKETIVKRLTVIERLAEKASA